MHQPPRSRPPAPRAYGGRCTHAPWALMVLAIWVALGVTSSAAFATPGFASAGAETLWLVAAETTFQADGAPESEALRTGLWLDVDGGDRDGQAGLIWGGRLGLTGAGRSRLEALRASALRASALGASALGGAVRVGVARSLLAWNRWWAGELVVTADLWAAYDKATWFSAGFRAAPRLGLRALFGYGSAVRARLRVDVAPVMIVSERTGQDTRLSAIWLRAGIDLGPVTIGGWGRLVAGSRVDATPSRGLQDLSVGVSLGLRTGRGGRR